MLRRYDAVSCSIFKESLKPGEILVRKEDMVEKQGVRLLNIWTVSWRGQMY